jgi:hypothetical protein
MASSSSHNSNDGIPLATLLEWFKICDTFFGDNLVAQNVPLALELASSCQHPDARWLTKVCSGKVVQTKEDAKIVFSSLGQNDARALCFAWCLSNWEFDLDPLRRSAKLGFAFALTRLARRTRGEERFKVAELAAAEGERDGFYHLGNCLCSGEGCVQDLKLAKHNFLLASHLDHSRAMLSLGELFDESDPQRWRWLGQAAARGLSARFMESFAKTVKLFYSRGGNKMTIFIIGRALHGHVNARLGTIFKDATNFESLIGPANQAISFYQGQLKACRDAVDEWTKVARRFNVVKDVRKLISQLIWDSREEAWYSLSNKSLRLSMR